MSSDTIEYHSEHVKCPKCGTINIVQVVTDYNTEDEDYELDIAEYQECSNCHHKFEAIDLED